MGVRDRMAYSYILVLAIIFLSVLDCESCKDKNDPKLVKWKGKHPVFQSTISGKECQMWSEDKPHKKNYSPEDKNHNYCRNPSKYKGGLWCYTTDPETRWERCHQPPPCDDCKTKDDPKVVKNVRCGPWISHTNVFTAPKKRKIVIARILTQNMLVDSGATRPTQRKDGKNVFNLRHVMDLLVLTKKPRPPRSRSRIVINLI